MNFDWIKAVFVRLFFVVVSIFLQIMAYGRWIAKGTELHGISMLAFKRTQPRVAICTNMAPGNFHFLNKY